MALELFEEPQIAVEEKLDVVDAILHHRKTVDSQTKCPARIAVGVNSAVLQHLGMNHAAPHHFNPTALLADGTPLTVANRATHVDLTTGFGEGEEAGAKAGPHCFTKELLGEEIQRAFQIGEGNVHVDGEPFHLVKHG